MYLENNKKKPFEKTFFASTQPCNLKDDKVGIDSGTVVRAVVSVSEGPGFKSSQRQFLCIKCFFINWMEKYKKLREKESVKKLTITMYKHSVFIMIISFQSCRVAK